LNDGLEIMGRTPMEPTEKQLTDFWLLIEDYTGETTVGERMRRAWKFVEYETGNAMYLAQAHRLCTELGISQGHIEDRLFEAIGKVQTLVSNAKLTGAL
jgi:hypothetical protein